MRYPETPTGVGGSDFEIERPQDRALSLFLRTTFIFETFLIIQANIGDLPA